MVMLSTTSLADPRSNPRAGMVDQLAVYPSGVDRFVAISRQMGDYCRGYCDW